MQSVNFRIEHVAVQVSDPISSAQWLVKNLGMKIVRQGPGPVNMTFLVDTAGCSMLEIYNNSIASVPDYRAMHPLHLHIAFVVDDIQQASAKLLQAGATVADAMTTTPAGDVVMMLRDPWGLAIQLVKRNVPML